MMNNYVSLLPVEYRQKLADEAKQKKILYITMAATGVLAAVFVVTVGIQLFLLAGIAEIETNVEGVSAQISTYGELETMYQETEELKAKVSSVEDLNPQWLDALYQFGEALPKGVWMEGINCTSTGKTARVIVAECGGNAYSEISKTILALEAIPVVESAQCISSSISAGGNENGSLKFTLSVKLQDETPLN